MTTASSAKAPTRPAHGLAAPDKFFAAIRPLFGKMTPAQVEGIEAKLAAFAAARRRGPLEWLVARLSAVATR